MKIEEQKGVADELLDAIEKACPHVILAGGAPRDWYFGNPCNDLDIYYSLDPENTMGADTAILKYVLPEGMVLNKSVTPHLNPLYKKMEALRRISTYTYRGMSVQLIRVHKQSDVYKVVGNMDCSICQVWYKNKKIGLYRNFKTTVASNIMFLNKPYTWQDPHPVKMWERFGKTVQRGTEEQARNSLINKRLKEIH